MHVYISLFSVIIMSFYPTDNIHFLLSASDQGMNNGDYVFIGIDVDLGRWTVVF